jgi:hypothetical protein
MGALRSIKLAGRDTASSHVKENACMPSKKLLFVRAFALCTGTLAGNITATPKKKLCIPCTPYCKAHPNAPRYN